MSDSIIFDALENSSSYVSIELFDIGAENSRPLLVRLFDFESSLLDTVWLRLLLLHLEIIIIELYRPLN
jgi:hypothetical protein